jgi:putative ABC transport system permease protein
VESLGQDLRIAFRALRRSPGFVFLTVFILALGIGANTALFSILDGVLLRPLPYPGPDRLVMIWEDWSRRDGPVNEWTNPATFFDWHDQGKSFQSMAALINWQPTLVGDGEPEQLAGALVTHEMFSTLGIAPALGQDFLPDQDVPNAERVVVISHGLWKRRFGASRTVLGEVLSLNGIPSTVIGVMPQSFRFPAIPDAEIWAPMRAERAGRGNAVIRVIGRLKPDIELDSARAEMRLVAGRIESQFPDTNKGIGAAVVPLRENFAAEARRPMVILFGAVACVLLIACANVANLLLSRATARHREIAIRRALGASRGRIVRQLLTESLVLGVLSGVAGLGIAWWGIDLLRSGLPDALSYFDTDPSYRVLGFTLLLSLATPLLFGLAPALASSRTGLAPAMREGSLGSGETRASTRQALVVAEVALSLVLLTGGGLLLKSFASLLATNPGIEARNLTAVTLILPSTRYPERAQVAAFYERLVERTAQAPGVTGLGLISNVPFGGTNTDASFSIEGRPEPPPDRRPTSWYSSISPGYLTAARLRLIRGRNFDTRDTEGSQRVLLINESLARAHFPKEDPIGKRLGYNTPKGVEWREIVGVVGDVRTFSLEKDEPPTVYFPFMQIPSRRASLVARLNDEAAAARLRALVREQDPQLVASIDRVERLLSGILAPRRWAMLLLVSFALLAVILAVVGIYGVMSYAVTRRTQEIGIRMALGARQREILGLMLRQGLRLAVVGTMIGVACSFALTRWMDSLLYRVSATDPLVFAGVALLMLAVAAAACYLPARRASRVDPMVALRYE